MTLVCLRLLPNGQCGITFDGQLCGRWLGDKWNRLQSLPDSLIIPAGQTSAAVTVIPIDDTIVEGDESVFYTSLRRTRRIHLGSPASASIVITDTSLQIHITRGPTGTIATKDATFAWSGVLSTAYAYRLDPIEPAFSAFGGPQTKSYTNLPDGSYTFYVKARSQAGIETLLPAGTRGFHIQDVSTIGVHRYDCGDFKAGQTSSSSCGSFLVCIP